MEVRQQRAEGEDGLLSGRPGDLQCALQPQGLSSGFGLESSQAVLRSSREGSVAGWIQRRLGECRREARPAAAAVTCVAALAALARMSGVGRSVRRSSVRRRQGVQGATERRGQQK